MAPSASATLGGKFAAFYLDPVFSNTVDGLITVDLRQAPRKPLVRYLGPRGTENFLH
jgi:hypothetical protein